LARLTTGQVEDKASFTIQKFHCAIPEKNQSWITIAHHSPECIIFLAKEKRFIGGLLDSSANENGVLH
jgi:hypothetical protein